MSFLHKFTDIITGVADADSYKLAATHIVGAVSFIVMLEGATEVLKFIGAGFFVLAGLMGILIKRKEYWRAARESWQEFKDIFKIKK